MSFFKTPDNTFKQHWKRRGLDTNSILGLCDADMNMNCQFQNFYIVLTKEQLVFITRSDIITEKVYAGYPKKGAARSLDADQWEMQFFNVSDLEDIGWADMVSGGVFFIRQKGEETRLCCASGQYMPGLRKLCEIFKKVKAGDPLTEEDYSQDEKPEFCEVCGTPYIDRERKICPKCMDHRSLFLRTLSYFKPYTGKMIFTMFMLVVSAGLNAVMPYLTGAVYFDQVLGKQSQFTGVWRLAGGDFLQLLFLNMGLFLVLRLLVMGADILRGLLVAKIVPRVLQQMKDDIFRSLRTLSLKFFTDRQTGPLMTRVLGDASQVTGFFIDGLPYVFGDIIMVISLVCVMFALKWQLAILAVTMTPVLTVISNLLLPRLWHLHGRRHRAARSMNGVLNDSLTGARVIKAFGREQSAIAGFEKASARMAGSEVSIVAYENRFSVLYSSFNSILNLAVWCIGAWLILMTDETGISYGMLAAFISYVALLSGPLQRMVDLFRWGTSSMNAAQRMFEIMDARPDIVEKKDPVQLQTVRGEVELRDVTFSYQPGNPVLKNVSLHIPAGEMLGIVGRSGVGKSTLVSLIARLYDADSGRILIDGIPIEDLSFDTLHRCVSTVSQESYVFMGTVAENIAYVRPEATREEIIKAAISASAHDFICKMPDGYDTVIGSGGRQLSGGERQRLSVARAILADTPILILDEATASVDTATERSIQQALDRLTKGRTTISIAHRLSTLKGADKLLVLDEGKVAEYGTHEQLMEQQGIYYKLVELQSKALSLEAMQKAAEGKEAAAIMI